MVTFLGRSLRTRAETRMKEILQAEKEDDHGQLRIRPRPRLQRIAVRKLLASPNTVQTRRMMTFCPALDDKLDPIRS